MKFSILLATVALAAAPLLGTGAVQAKAIRLAAVTAPNAATEARYANDRRLSTCTRTTEEFRHLNAAFDELREAAKALPPTDAVKRQMKTLVTDVNDERMEMRNRVDRGNCPTKI